MKMSLINEVNETGTNLDNVKEQIEQEVLDLSTQGTSRESVIVENPMSKRKQHELKGSKTHKQQYNKVKFMEKSLKFKVGMRNKISSKSNVFTTDQKLRWGASAFEQMDACLASELEYTKSFRTSVDLPTSVELLYHAIISCEGYKNSKNLVWMKPSKDLIRFKFNISPVIDDPTMQMGEMATRNYESLKRQHILTQQHHPEFWTVQRENKNKQKYVPSQMTPDSTVELLVDHWISALRIQPDMTKALFVALSWIADLSGPTLVIRPKYKKLNPCGVMYLARHLKMFGMPNKPCYGHKFYASKRDVAPTEQDRIVFRRLLGMVKQMSTTANVMGKLEILKDYINIGKTSPKFMHFVAETRIHILSVENMMDALHLNRKHDRDKMSIDMMTFYYWNWSMSHHSDPTTGDLIDCRCGSPADMGWQCSNCHSTSKAAKPIVEAARKTIIKTGQILFPEESDMLKDSFDLMNNVVRMSHDLVLKAKNALQPIFSFLKIGNHVSEAVEDLQVLAKVVKYYVLILNTNNTTLKAIFYINIFNALGIWDRLKEAVLEWFPSFGDKLDSLKEELKEKETPTSSSWFDTVIGYVEKGLDTLSPEMIGKILGIAGVFLIGKNIFGRNTLPKDDQRSMVTKTIETFKDLHFMGGGLLGASRLIEGLTKVTKITMDYVNNKFFKRLSSDQKVAAEQESNLVRYQQWVTRVEAFSVDAVLTSLHKDRLLLKEAGKVYTEGLELMKLIGEGKLTIHRSEMIRYLDKSRLIENAVYRIESGINWRPTPIHICLSGLPGVGKSRLLEKIVDIFHDERFPGYDKDNMVYSTNGATQHEDGYMGQVVYLMDDANGFDNIEKAWRIVPMVSNVPYTMPQASLPDKGKQFSSHIILSTTNTLYPKFTGLFCKEAIWRRRHLLIVVKMDPRVVDPNTKAFSRELFDKFYPNQDPLDFPHLTFDFAVPCPKTEPVGGNYEIVTEQIAGVPKPYKDMSFKDLIKKMLSQYDYFQKHEAQGCGKNKHLAFQRLADQLRDIDEVYDGIRDRIVTPNPYETFRHVKLGLAEEPSKHDPEPSKDEVEEFERNVASNIEELKPVEHQMIVNFDKTFEGMLSDIRLFSTNIAGDYSKDKDMFRYVANAALFSQRNFKELSKTIINTYVELKKNIAIRYSNVDLEPVVARFESDNDFRDKLENLSIYGAIEVLPLMKFAKLSTKIRDMYTEFPTSGDESFEDATDQDPLDLIRLRNNVQIDALEIELDQIKGNAGDFIRNILRDTLRDARELEVAPVVLQNLIISNKIHLTKDTITHLDRFSDQYLKNYNDLVLLRESERANRLGRPFSDRLPYYFGDERIIKDGKSLWEMRPGQHYALEVYGSADDAKNRENKSRLALEDVPVNVFYDFKMWDKQREEFDSLADHPSQKLREDECLSQAFLSGVAQERDATTDRIKYYHAGIYGWNSSSIIFSKTLGYWIEATYQDRILQCERLRDDATRFFEFSELQRAYLINACKQRGLTTGIARYAFYRACKTSKKVVKSIWNMCVGGLKYVWSHYKQVARFLIRTAVVCAVMMLLTRIARMFVPETTTSGFRMKTGVPMRFGNSSTVTSGEFTDHVNAKILNNLLPAMVGFRSINAIGLRNGMVLIPYHSILYAQNKQGEFHLSISPTKNIEKFALNMIISPHQWKRVPGTDAAVVFTRELPTFKDITTRFVSDQDLGNEFKDKNVHVPAYEKTGLGHYVVQVVSAKSNHPVYVEGKTLAREHVLVLNTDLPKGTSGAPVLGMRTISGEERIIQGIQSSSQFNEHLSHTSTVTREALKEVIESFSNSPDVVCCAEVTEPLYVDSIQPTSTSSDLLGPSLQFMGTMMEHRVITSEKTVFQKTWIAADFVSERVPALLSNRDQRAGKNDVAKHSINKYGRDRQKPLPPRILNYCVKAYASWIAKQLQDKGVKPLRILTIEEAILGVNGSDHMPLKTSPGLPWCLNRDGKKGKTPWITISPEGELWVADELVEAVYSKIRDYASGIIPPGTCVDFLKDELRPATKAYGLSQEQVDDYVSGNYHPIFWPADREVKTRIITVMDFVDTIIYRMINGDFTSKRSLLADGTNPHCVGINPESTAALNAYFCFKEKSEGAVDLDVKNWDGHFTNQLAYATVDIQDIVWTEYREREPNHLNLTEKEIKTIRYALVRKAIYAFVQYGPTLYQKFVGLISGSPWTANDNTDAHILLVFVFFVMKAKEKNVQYDIDFAFLFKIIFYLCYGDDILISISEEGKKIMDYQELVDMYVEHGWPVTSADKSMFITERPLETCQFLKRSFVRDQYDAYWMHWAIDKETINSLLHWMRRSDNPKQQFYNNIEIALEFAFAHGRAYYTELHTQINNSLRNRGLTQVFRPYFEMRQIMYRRYFGGYGCEYLSTYFDDPECLNDITVDNLLGQRVCNARI